jgi:selenocysteine lyase/cysteine desulfurase
MVDPMRLDIAPTAMRPQPTALRFLMTTPDLVAATSLGIALRLLAEVTEEVVDRVVSSHVARLCEGIQHIGGSLLVPLGPRDRSGIVSFHVPGHSLASIGDVLVARGLVVSVRADHVRISPHATTSSDVIDEVIAARATGRGARCR